MAVAKKGIVLLLAVLGGHALAQDRYDHWSVTRLDEGYAAGTPDINDRGEFGLMCFENKHCVWALLTAERAECADNAQTHGMMTSDRSTFRFNAECRQAGEGTYHFIPANDEATRVVQGSGILSVAISAVDGTVQRFSFSLAGSEKATAAVRSAVRSSKK